MINVIIWLLIVSRKSLQTEGQNCMVKIELNNEYNVNFTCIYIDLKWSMFLNATSTKFYVM